MRSLNNIYENVRLSLEREVLPVISFQLDNEVNRMVKIIEHAIQFYTSNNIDSEKNTLLSVYRKELYNLIQTEWNAEELVDFTTAYPSFVNVLNDIFIQLDEEVVLVQSRNRYYVQESDSFGLIINKYFKRLIFNVYSSPQRIGNLFKSNKAMIPFRQQKIPLRSLSGKHFHGSLVYEFIKITDIIFLSISQQYKALKLWESTLNESNELRGEDKVAEIHKFKKELMLTLDKEISAILEKIALDFSHDYERTGTIELPARKLKDDTIKEIIQESEEKWSLNNAGWKNTIYGVLEKWRSDLDILVLKNNIEVELSNFQNAQIKKLIEHIEPEILAIQVFIDEAVSAINHEPESITKGLKKIVYQANKTLDKDLVPKLCEKLSSKNITGLVSKLEIDVRNHVDLISSDHVLVKDESFDKPIEKNELINVSLNELIKFEILSVFQDDLDNIKKGLFSSLENTTSQVSDLDHIITFSLNSAISAGEDEHKANEEVVSIALEGLSRASARLQSTRLMLEESLTANNKNLIDAVSLFCNSITKLTIHENLRQLKLRITKAKATHQAEEVKKEVQDNLIKKKEGVFTFLKETYQKGKEKLNFLSDKFILTAGKPVLSRDVSDFLLESQSAIDKLPSIYKRLYRIEPLDDMELFEGREVEIGSFKDAFSSWQKGRYVTTVLLGEKWGGLTTFLNFSAKKDSFPYAVKRLSIHESTCDPEQFLELFKVKFNQASIDSLNDLIDYLNSNSKQVIIIENLQKLYLRKTGGFEAIHAYLKLISNTCTNVFWVTTSTIYTWSYLKKTIKIEEFFSNEIEMKEFTKEQITNVVWKRNRISGFNIRFLINRENEKDKKFLKYDDEKQQSILKEEFFASLNAFSKSNVSLALIYWLLSTREVDEQTITIGEFQAPNLSFLSSLSMDKVYVLLALVLHDGMTLNQLAKVLNTEQKSCEQSLFALLKDGIVMNKENQYTINPIVYRNTVSLLKAKNLIH